jgi:hypothetical protein
MKAKFKKSNNVKVECLLESDASTNVIHFFKTKLFIELTFITSF